MDRNPPFEKCCLNNYSLICNYLFNKNFQICSGTTRMPDALSQTLSTAICERRSSAQGWRNISLGASGAERKTISISAGLQRR